MTFDPDNIVIEAVDRLERSVDGLRSEIAGLHTYGRRNRRLIWGLAISLALDVILTIAVTLLAAQAVSTSEQANNASSLANRTREVQMITCRSGNEAREAQIRLWNYILALSARNDATPQRLAQVEEFQQYLASVFAPRDCDSPTPTAVMPPSTVTSPSSFPTAVTPSPTR